MFRKRILAVGATLLLAALPASAQHKGGGGHPGGGHPGGYSGGYHGGHSSFSLGIGLGFGGLGGFGGGYGGYGGYGGGYGGGYVRPSYSLSNYGSGGYYGPAPYVVSPRIVRAPSAAYTYPELINPSMNPTLDTQPRPAAIIPIPAGVETGLRITELSDGTAKVAGLRKGDIILKVDGVRTQNFEELRATLLAGKDKVVIEFIDANSGETDQKTVGIQNTKLGVTVSETAVPKT